MKQLCLISPAFAFRVGERGIFFPHGELARALLKRGIKTTIICLGPNITHTEGDITVYAVPSEQANSQMLSDWMPSNSYYLGAATALWRKYKELLDQNQIFDLLDAPAYLPFNEAALSGTAALIVRAYRDDMASGNNKGEQSFPVDKMMLQNIQAQALLQADAVMVDEYADAESNRWSRKLRNTFTVKLMSELEACVYSDDKALLPKNDLRTIVLGSSETDAEWSVLCLRAVSEYLKQHKHVRFVVPIFQREVSTAEQEAISQLKQQLAEANLLDRLYLISPLAINKLGGCLTMAEAVVAPLRDSGLPSIGLESLAAGKPTIVHRQNPLASFVRMTSSGKIVDSNDVSQIVDAFSDILNDAEAGNRGKQSAQQLFEDYVNTSLRCYAQALEVRREEKTLQKVGSENTSTQENLLVACDRLLYDIHYKTSLRFRVKHWINRLTQKRHHPQQDG